MSKILISRLRKYSNVSIEMGAAATKKLLHFCNPRAAFTFYNEIKITFDIFCKILLVLYQNVLEIQFCQRSYTSIQAIEIGLNICSSLLGYVEGQSALPNFRFAFWGLYLLAQPLASSLESFPKLLALRRTMWALFLAKYLSTFPINSLIHIIYFFTRWKIM